MGLRALHGPSGRVALIRGLMGRSTSETAVQLSAQLEARGERVSPRQLERWRQAGLLGPVRQRGAGRGRGSTVELGEDAIDRATDAARLVRDNRSLGVAVLVMFGEGRFRVEKPELERAYAASFGGLGAKFLSASPTGDAYGASAEIGRRVGAKASRRPDHAAMRDRFRKRRDEGRFEPLAGLLERSYKQVALIVLTGRPTSGFALAELLRATGLGALVSERTAGQPSLVTSLPDLTEDLEAMSVPALGRVVCKTPLEDLEAARDYLNGLVNFARQAVPPIRTVFPDAFGFAALLTVSPLSVALAAPLVARLENRFPGEMARSQHLFYKARERWASWGTG